MKGIPTIAMSFIISIKGTYRFAAGPWPGYGTTHSGYGTTPVGWGGGNRYVEGDLLTFGYLMLNDSLGYPYFRLFNGNP